MKLLKLEYKKIVGNKSFWVFTLLFVVLLPLLVIFVPVMAGDEIEGVQFYPLIPRNSEVTWYAVTIVSSWFTFFLLNFVLIYHVTNEYTYRTVRQNVIDGLTRWNYIKGKVLLMLAISVLATIYVFLVGIIGGLYFSSVPQLEPNIIQKTFGVAVAETDGFGSLWDGVGNVMRFFIQTTATFSFAMLIAFLVRKGILAVLIFYSAFIIELIIGLILKGRDLGGIYDYFPLQTIGESLPLPDFKQLIMGITSPAEISWLNIIIVGGYTVLFLFLIKYLFNKRDIS